MNTPSLITRKEIAQMLGETDRAIGRNEQRLGLDTCRRDLSKRSVRYLREKALQILSDRGFLPNTSR